MPLSLFFTRFPALYYALFVASAITIALQQQFIWGLAALATLCFLFWRTPWRPCLGILLAATAYMWTISHLELVQLPEEGVVGCSQIHIEQVSLQRSRFGSHYLYKGSIKHFWGPISCKNQPFYLKIAANKERPPAHLDYLVVGTLFPSKGRRVQLTPTPHLSWTPIEATFSPAETRFWMKSRVAHWIKSHFHSPPVATFLSGLITGEFDDPQLIVDFSRFGLLHLLAISGFHFSILATLLSKIFQPFVRPQWLSWILLMALTGYFLFLGWGPSVLRAWMTILVFYHASLTERRSDPLNALGLALLISLCIDPLLLENLGFQFSFLTTAAILLFQKPIHKAFENNKKTIEPPLPPLAYQGKLLLKITTNNLSLSAATLFIALPLSLFYFQKFPLLSLLYNLFFPPLVGVSMTLLILGLLASPLPWLAAKIHITNDYFTSFLLNCTYQIPSSLDKHIYSPPFPGSVAALLISIIFLLHIVYFYKIEPETF